MITTGIRTPVGVRVMGPDLNTIERVGLELEKVLQQVPGTRSAFFERVTGLLSGLQGESDGGRAIRAPSTLVLQKSGPGSSKP
jgi:hypothetical protein